MTQQNDLTADQRAWELMGAQEVCISVHPLHLHTATGLPVKITGIAVDAGAPRLVGTVFAGKGGKVDLRWTVEGAALADGAENYELSDRHSEVLRVLAGVAARLAGP